MFWRRERASGAPEEGAEPVSEEYVGPIRIEPDAPRPATILRVAGELEGRGGKILELFKEIESPDGRVVLPIHLLQDDEDFFVEVETKRWDREATEEAIHKAAVVRASEHAETELELLSAYPVPEEVSMLFERCPAALLQLDMLRTDPVRPEASAEIFREAAGRRWGVDLGYEPDYLPLVEQLLNAALRGEEPEERPPVLDGLVVGLGCFVGETIRRNLSSQSAWRRPEDWSEGPVIELEGLALDPLGQARAFLREDAGDSVAFYAEYVLNELAHNPQNP